MGKNAFHSFLPHFPHGVDAVIQSSSSSSTSISPRRCALSTVGGRSFARADFSAMRKWTNTVLSWSETRPTPRLAQRAPSLLSQKGLR
jgi:hypothetical protein